MWEAIADPALQGLGNVMWVVDINRQSLDRVVPDQKIKKLMEFFDGAGWHVVEAKYGRLLQAAFDRPGGDALRRHIDEMSNEEYQSLFAHRGAELRERFLAGADAEVVDGCSPTSPTTTSPRSCRTSAATTSACCSTPTGRATPTPTGRASCSPTPSRAGACRSPATR